MNPMSKAPLYSLLRSRCAGDEPTQRFYYQNEAFALTELCYWLNNNNNIEKHTTLQVWTAATPALWSPGNTLSRSTQSGDGSLNTRCPAEPRAGTAP